jgi:hypothetical protein
VVDVEASGEPVKRMKVDVAEQRAQMRRMSRAGLEHPFEVLATSRRTTGAVDGG